MEIARVVPKLASGTITMLLPGAGKQLKKLTTLSHSEGFTELEINSNRPGHFTPLHQHHNSHLPPSAQIQTNNINMKIQNRSMKMDLSCDVIGSILSLIT